LLVTLRQIQSVPLVLAALPAFWAPACAGARPATTGSDCLPATGQVVSNSIRGVRVGSPAQVRDGNGNPLSARSVSYCVSGGGQFSYALDHSGAIVLVASTAPGDATGPMHPGARLSSRAARRRPLARSRALSLYRLDRHRQLVYAIAARRVVFIACADRLLLQAPGKLVYWIRRLQLPEPVASTNEPTRRPGS
jgi:hypothetical protein